MQLPFWLCGFFELPHSLAEHCALCTCALVCLLAVVILFGHNVLPFVVAHTHTHKDKRDKTPPFLFVCLCVPWLTVATVPTPWAPPRLLTPLIFSLGTSARVQISAFDSNNITC